MIKCKCSSALNGAELLAVLRRRWRTHDRGWGLFALICTFAFLSILAGLFQGGHPDLYLAGEIASQDVTADRELLVEDEHATRMRREQLAAIQPRIFDVDRAALLRFREETLTLLRTAELAAELAAASDKAEAGAAGKDDSPVPSGENGWNGEDEVPHASGAALPRRKLPTRRGRQEKMPGAAARGTPFFRICDPAGSPGGKTQRKPESKAQVRLFADLTPDTGCALRSLILICFSRRISG